MHAHPQGIVDEHTFLWRDQLNRSEAMAKAAETAGLPLPVVEEAVGAFLGVCSRALVEGETVSLRRFGKFEPRLRRSQTKPNPRTGQTMIIPERLSVAFLPSDLLKEEMNG
jgi:nucleoid DNA-binding protein